MSKAPVELAFERHIHAIHTRDREAFLNNLSEDVIFQDPVGMPRLSDPEGSGLIGRDAVAEMWDMVQGNEATGDVRFEMDRGFVCGDEVAYIGQTVSNLPNPNGDGTIECIAEGVFCYKVNDEGKISHVRAFFDFEKAYGAVNLD